MLIPSHRHTAADLALWREMEEGDSAHAGTPVFREKIIVARHQIASFLAAGPAYGSVSWGKDSVAMAHLLWTVSPQTPLANLLIRATIAPNPDSDSVARAFLAAHPMPYLQAQGAEDCQHDFARLRAATGLSRHLSGVRADESGARRISARHLGVATAVTCRPLLWWTTAEVFAYLAVNRLPVHPAYAMTGGGRWDRERLRVSSLGGERGGERGRREWEREYYGDVLNRIKLGTRSGLVL